VNNVVPKTLELAVADPGIPLQVQQLHTIFNHKLDDKKVKNKIKEKVSSNVNIQNLKLRIGWDGR
jgi:hypothetical protein